MEHISPRKRQGHCRRAAGRFGTAAILVSAVLLSAACVTGGEHIDDLSQLGPNQMVVAGKIVLDPPLEKEEQDLYFTAAHMRGKVYFLLGEENVDPGDMGMKEMDMLFSAELGEPFFVPVERMVEFYFSSAFVQMIFTPERDDRLYLPAGLRLKVPEGAKAVSMGTLVYKRDVFNEFQEVQLTVDDPELRQSFRSRFGDAYELVPAQVSIAGMEDEGVEVEPGR